LEVLQMETFTLANRALEMTFDRERGSLCGLTARETGWKILSRPNLGLSFQLLVPMRQDGDWHQGNRLRNNLVLGEKQRLEELEIAPDGQKAVMVWEGLESEKAGRLDIRFRIEVALDERQVIFITAVENHSPYVIENVSCPYLGDFQPPVGAEWLRSFSYNYGTAVEHMIWPTFQNMRGYYGVDYPIQLEGPAACGTPMTPFMLLRSLDQGLYLGVHAPSAELVAWQAELRPGYSNSIDSRVPESLELSGKEVTTRIAAVHVPYILPGESRTLTPIELEAFQGDWQAGAGIYKHWRSGWMKPAQPPKWACEPHAWQQIHINSPEDELRTSFQDLVEVGEECARHGVKAIQLVGWNDGGQDQGNPSHNPDSRLGSFEELQAAIAKIQILGVKVVLFAKFTWADRATERFRKELVRWAVKDPYDDYYHYPGYQYQTATQLLDINTKRLIPMCFLSEDYLRICEEEFKKTLALGADGILFDECQHHGPALLCFDTGHGHRYGAPVYANDRKLIENFRRLAQEANQEFLFAGEACYDWEMEAYHLAYFRTENKQHIPLSRYLLPEGLYMTAVTGFNDRNMINQCLLYRYIISYEPYNFKGRLEDFPLTLAYGKKMDALRTELRDYFWEGEFCGTRGVEVRLDGKTHHPYAVFLNRKNGKHGAVVANYDEQRTVRLDVRLTNGGELQRYRLVDDPEWKRLERGIMLPPCSAGVVV
jgi:hypothetical protein